MHGVPPMIPRFPASYSQLHKENHHHNNNLPRFFFVNPPPIFFKGKRKIGVPSHQPVPTRIKCFLKQGCVERLRAVRLCLVSIPRVRGVIHGQRPRQPSGSASFHLAVQIFVALLDDVERQFFVALLRRRTPNGAGALDGDALIYEVKVL